MATTETGLRSDALVEAMARADVEAISPLLAPDIVLHSPILSTPFRGRAAVAPLLAVVGEVVEDQVYTRKLVDGDTEILFSHGRVGDVELDAIVQARFDDAGLSRETTVMFRPLRAIAAFIDATGPKLAKSPGRARLLRAGGPGMRGFAALTDRLAERSIRMH